MAKDRHRPGYYEEYSRKRGKKDRHRPGYYTEYNLKHPERLKRIGINIENKEENKQYKKTIKIYVSLPITGQESTVMERCMEAKERLEKIFKEADTQDYELEVVFPKDVDKIGTPEQDNTKSLGYWLGEDIKLLMNCDAVFLCEGYIRSGGCKLEYRCASLYKKTILKQCYPIAGNVFELEELISELDKRV